MKQKASALEKNNEIKKIGKIKKGKTQIDIRNNKGDITIDPAATRRMSGKRQEQL